MNQKDKDPWLTHFDCVDLDTPVLFFKLMVSLSKSGLSNSWYVAVAAAQDDSSECVLETRVKSSRGRK